MRLARMLPVAPARLSGDRATRRGVVTALPAGLLGGGLPALRRVGRHHRAGQAEGRQEAGDGRGLVAALGHRALAEGQAADSHAAATRRPKRPAKAPGPGLPSAVHSALALGSQEKIAREFAAWENKRNARQARIHWTFTLAAARLKLRKTYPSNEAG